MVTLKSILGNVQSVLDTANGKTEGFAIRISIDLVRVIFKSYRICIASISFVCSPPMCVFCHSPECSIRVTVSCRNSRKSAFVGAIPVSYQPEVLLILLAATFSPPNSLINCVQSASVGTRHPSGHSFPVLAVYQLYKASYLFLFAA